MFALVPYNYFKKDLKIYKYILFIHFNIDVKDYN